MTPYEDAPPSRGENRLTLRSMRWIDEWGQRWGHRLGEVRCIRDDELWASLHE
jgi:hypothetical protein